MSKKVIVIGAGASGMIAAISAARSGASVTLLEGNEKPGKKLLATGNGRCNLTNMDPALSMKYHGSGKELARQITDRYDSAFVRDFFWKNGLCTYDKNRYVYPFTNQASSVLECLLTELERLKVKCKCSQKVTALTYMEDDKQWNVATDGWTYQADAVILSSGSMAMPVSGADASGISMAEALGLKTASFSPALTSVICEGKFFSAVAGVRSKVRVSLTESMPDGRRIVIGMEEGELQWTKYGVSGIVIFQLSTYVKNQNQSFVINLLPDYNSDDIVQMITERAKELAGFRLSRVLSGLLHEKLIPVLLDQAGISQKLTCDKADPELIRHLIYLAKAFPVRIKGKKGFDSCQVCSGGILAEELKVDTLETKKWRNLFVTGELVDVDGPCGGYNLQWAWASGYLAGQSAAETETI